MASDYSWSDLLPDILTEVAQHLSYPDIVRFGAVCKSWQVVMDTIQRRSIEPPLIAYQWQDNASSILVHLLDLSSKEPFSIKNKIPQGARSLIEFPTRLCCSKHGWLLFANFGNLTTTFFLYNPFRNNIVEMPPLDFRTLNAPHQFVATFTADPTSLDCVIFFLCRTDDVRLLGRKVWTISTCNLKDRTWSVQQNYTLCCNAKVEDVVYVDGILYCLFDTNYSQTLGLFDLALRDWVMMDSSASLPLKYYSENCLVESDGKLFLVALIYEDEFDDREELYRHIYEFDLSRKMWTRVKSLGSKVLFLGWASSVASLAEGRASDVANMIFCRGYWDGWYEVYTGNVEGEWKHHHMFCA